MEMKYLMYIGWSQVLAEQLIAMMLSGHQSDWKSWLKEKEP